MPKIKIIVQAAASVIGLATLLLATGCATTAPKATFTMPIAKTAYVVASDTVKAAVTAPVGVDMLDVEKTRLSQRIEERITSLKAARTGSSTRQISVEVEVTRYDKGNAFARAMIAGLGQIHIDGKVQVFELPEKKPLGSFDIKKTFAWGGIYGGATGIEDIERTFAEGIAAAVTGTVEQPKS